MRCTGFLTLIAALSCPMTAIAAEPASVTHSVVYAGENEFAGWPANEGLWQWGDEVLVGFNVTRVQQRDDFHNVDQAAYMWVNFARSTDGGETWTLESHPEVSIPGAFDANGKYVQQTGFPPIPRPVASPGNIDFTHPDFALKARNGRFWFSYDRGRNWQGPFELPKIDKQFIDARTNYLVLDSQTALIFIEATDIPRDRGEHMRIQVVQTTDGGKTFDRLSWLTPDPLEDGADIALAKPAYACMPGVEKLEDGTLLAAVRWSIAKHKWTDLVASTDAGRTWQRRSVIFDRNNNPASLIDLGNNRVAAIYGYRNPPYGLRAKISEDAGRTWSDEFVLRDDGREWDLGYVRAAKRTDGRIAVVYYYTTEEHPDEFIAATVWDPPAKTTPMRTLAVAADGTIVGEPMPFDEKDPGVVIESDVPQLKPGRNDFTLTGSFRAAPVADGGNRALLDNLHTLGGFGVFVGRSDRSYRGKLFFCVNGPTDGDDVTLFSDARIDDNKPHTFTITVKDAVIHMTLDGAIQKETVAYGPGSTATAPPQAPAVVGLGFVGTINRLSIDSTGER